MSEAINANDLAHQMGSITTEDASKSQSQISAHQKDQAGVIINGPNMFNRVRAENTNKDAMLFDQIGIVQKPPTFTSQVNTWETNEPQKISPDNTKLAQTFENINVRKTT